MPQSVNILIPGIRTIPGDEKDWNVRGNTWTNLNTDRKADDCEYFCGAIGRAFGQQARSLKLLALLRHYAGWNITLAGHSNGCAVALQALQIGGWPCLKSLHLFNGACEASFQRNGLNQALRNGRIGSLSVYLGGKDLALKLASSWIARLLGYGILGLHGPRDVANDALRHLTVIKWEDYGHSTCWAFENFNATMKLII